VMVTIWRRAETYDAAKASVSTWIYTVARNRFIDKVRKEKRSEILMETDTERPSEDMAADDAMNLDQQTAALRVALKVLPPEQREAISMAFLREMSHGEIAAELDLPLGTVKSRIRLAMTRLRDQLESVR
ncbi:MAG TPA: sigma-70 family RNA polymerase sigma factor, partial [Alphaproteobacteria bacterium]|nr:sigma-70 family RNA polymerase sigma factor [Alphaproteobacteria bacterium]